MHLSKHKNITYAIILFFSAFIISINVQSQKLSNRQLLTIRKDLSKIITQDSESFLYNTSLSNITIAGSDTFYNPAGFHYLYQLKNDSAIRIDRSVFHGHNFYRLFYSYNSRLYLLGGYGYFTTNNNLEVYDSKTREWSYVPTKGDKPDFILGILYKKQDYIYCINTIKSGNSAEPDSFSNHIYVLDLKTNTWSKHKNTNKEILGIDFHRNFNTSKYLIGFCNRTNKVLVINKEAQSYFLKSFSSIHLNSNHFDVKELDSNTITFINTASISSNNFPFTVNLDSLYNMHFDEFQPLVIRPAFYQEYFELIITLIAIGVIVVVIFLLRRNFGLRVSSSRKDVQTDKQISKYIERLCQIESEILTIEELDEVLEIDHMENESKKSKRHRILTTIKNDYPGFIVRVKDENDKRKFIYIIDKKQIKSY